MDVVEKLFHVYKGKIQHKFKQALANQRAEHLSLDALLCSLKTKIAQIISCYNLRSWKSLH